MAKLFRISKCNDFRLKDVDPNDTLEYTKEADKPRAKEALATGITALSELQGKLYAQGKWAVLLILRAMDVEGKDGATKHVMSGFNHQSSQVYSFKSPSSEDPDHDCLLRCTLAAMAIELTGKGIRSQTVEAYSSVRDRLWHEDVDQRLGGLNCVTSVDDVIDHLLNEREKSCSDLNSTRVA